MVTDVYVIYNDDNQLRRIGGSYTLRISPFFHFIDDRTLHGRKDAYKLKSEWAARLTPFALCMDGEKPIKAFYTETDNDVIKSLIQYLNEFC